MSSPAAVADRELYRWQLDALVSWLRCGRQGVIEAVTGSGKTDVAIAAAADALRRGRFVLVLVPSRVLMEQWHGRLTLALPAARIGRLGDSGRDGPADCDVLVATRHSAAAYRPHPGPAGGLLIADECHGLGGRTLRRAMLPQYEERLGLTATLERGDDAVTELLLPYFGGICYRYGFEQGIADGVCARPRVAFVGVALSDAERADYVAIEQRLVSARDHLRRIRDMPLDPFGDFMAAVAHLAERDAGADGRAARDYLDAFSKRRQIVAQTIGKYELLGDLAPAIKDAEGALVFTETVRAANHAINRLDPFVAVDLITGSTGRARRREILDDLRDRRLDAVAAPRVLDEGIDVPDANLGVVMSASRTRRQMIQRMGRILRRKRAGVVARFVIMFAKDTLEDPASRVERDGFLDEIERVSEATGVFDGAHFGELAAFLAVPGPAVVRAPEHLESYARATAPFDVETQYALRAFATDAAFGGRDDADLARLERALPAPSSTTSYLEPELAIVPTVKQPKVEPTRLSTGEVALQIARVGSAWRISCTGCGEASPLVQYRWQALDQTVPCRCAWLHADRGALVGWPARPATAEPPTRLRSATTADLPRPGAGVPVQRRQESASAPSHRHRVPTHGLVRKRDRPPPDRGRALPSGAHVVMDARRTGRIFGWLFIGTFVTSIPARLLFVDGLGAAWSDVRFVPGATDTTTLKIGAILEFGLIVTNIATAVVLYPLVVRQNPRVSLGYVGARIMESVFIAIGLMSIISVVNVSDALAGATGVPAAALAAQGKALVSTYEWAFQWGPGLVVGFGNGLMLGYLMYRSRLVPRRMAMLGLIGGPLLILSFVFILFGVYENGSGPATLLALPEIAWEASLGVYAAWKGFRMSPVAEPPMATA